MQWLEIGGLADLPKDPSFTNYTPAVAQAMAARDRRSSSAASSSAPRPTASWRRCSPRHDLRRRQPGQALRRDRRDRHRHEGGRPGRPAKRAGIFTQGAFLAAKADAGESHPPQRGDLRAAAGCCASTWRCRPTLPVPPVAEPSPDKTTRERFERAQRRRLRPGLPRADRPDRASPSRTTTPSAPTARPRTTSRSTPAAALKLDSGDAHLQERHRAGRPAWPRRPRSQDCMVTPVDALRPAPARAGRARSRRSRRCRPASRRPDYDLRELLVALTKTRAFTHRALSAGEVTR